MSLQAGTQCPKYQLNQMAVVGLLNLCPCGLQYCEDEEQKISYAEAKSSHTRHGISVLGLLAHTQILSTPSCHITLGSGLTLGLAWLKTAASPIREEVSLSSFAEVRAQAAAFFHWDFFLFLCRHVARNKFGRAEKFLGQTGNCGRNGPCCVALEQSR